MVGIRAKLRPSLGVQILVFLSVVGKSDGLAEANSRSGTALSVWACPPYLRSVARAGEVKKTFSHPTSCLLCAFCDHRWSGLWPCKSFRPETLESFLPSSRVWSLRMK